MVTRRRAIEMLAAGAAAAGLGCTPEPSGTTAPRQGSAGQGSVGQGSVGQGGARAESSATNPILRVEALRGPPWQTLDPFLFCVHHLDRYPRGNERMGPAASLAGRRMGNDFAGIDGWRMYHGDVVPGFPRHPHRGFETVTVVRRGLLDHADSLGATARYGDGDVQWLTAGGGIQHAEMFPLLERDRPNTAELFQIWLNLPSTNKMVDAHFSMLWKPSIPVRNISDNAGLRTRLTVVAGEYEGDRAPPPPPNSWASASGSDVAIWSIAMDAGARFQLPAAPEGVNRALYFFEGQSLMVASTSVQVGHQIVLQAEEEVPLQAGPAAAEILLLQGRPIGEPVARQGPFVMNTRQEIRQAYLDYQRTNFGGWPWPNNEPVHRRDQGRFAQRPGRGIERPPS
ncbi:MAG: pirin-like C-terminal cupin domain-containing protein [Myxococcota bacterium]